MYYTFYAHLHTSVHRTCVYIFAYIRICIQLYDKLYLQQTITSDTRKLLDILFTLFFENYQYPM